MTDRLSSTSMASGDEGFGTGQPGVTNLFGERKGLAYARFTSGVMSVPRLYDSTWDDGFGIGPSGVLSWRASALKEAVVVGRPTLASCQLVRSLHYRSTGVLRCPPAGSKSGLE
ncbi:hypothetical protein ACCO45_002785 [Purpureocillium lilacinum]|uniref:Uncharacterized protein n=1 Tax=Purpureocillium lilacinum TaxID=33203 RepID=A0ACC4DZB7_PURLI